MNEGDKYDLSVPGWQTTAYYGIKLFLGTLASAHPEYGPLVGPIVAEVFSEVFAAPTARRKDEVLALFADGLGRVGMDVETLKDQVNRHDTLFDTMAFAIPAAIRTASQEKRKALRNAVLNTAVQRGPGEHLQSIYLSLINSLTPSHLILLREVAVPHPDSPHMDKEYAYPDNIRYRSEEDVLTAAFADKAIRWSVGTRVFKDAVADSLIEPATWGGDFREVQRRKTSPELTKAYLGRTFSHVRPTEFAAGFLKFISEPPELYELGETPEPQA